MPFSDTCAINNGNPFLPMCLEQDGLNPVPDAAVVLACSCIALVALGLFHGINSFCRQSHPLKTISQITLGGCALVSALIAICNSNEAYSPEECEQHRMSVIRDFY